MTNRKTDEERLKEQQKQPQAGNQQPGAESKWQGRLDGVIDKILNRDKFSFDLNGDAFHRQYKDQYTQQGKMAMMDTVGQAAALTGGYGSTYAQQVGQQAYQGYLQGLNDRIPELYRLALDTYDREGNNLLNQYSMLADLDNREYSRGRDAVADQQWQQSFDYGKERDAVSDAQWRESFDYGKSRDKVSDAQWMQSFDHQKDRDAVADSQWEKNYALDKLSAEMAREELDYELGKGSDDEPGTTGNTGGTESSADNDNVNADKVQNLLSGRMTLQQARSRGITEKEYAAMVSSWLDKADLTEAEFEEIERRLGLS